MVTPAGSKDMGCIIKSILKLCLDARIIDIILWAIGNSCALLARLTVALGAVTVSMFIGVRNRISGPWSPAPRAPRPVPSTQRRI